VSARVDWDRPAVTPEGRREQLDRELAMVAESRYGTSPVPFMDAAPVRVSASRRAREAAGVRVDRVQAARDAAARRRALARLIAAHGREFAALLADEIARGGGAA
jgi:hypothetical protein